MTIPFFLLHKNNFQVISFKLLIKKQGKLIKIFVNFKISAINKEGLTMKK